MAFCFFLTGPRGSGKGVYSVKMITDTLKNENRVASNIDVEIDNLSFLIKKPLFTRLPDKPRSTDLFALGAAYDMSEGIDPDREGLIILDEISLFLNTRKDKDFDELMRFFMLSRKLGWNLVFVCQNKDQVQDTFYKSLCNKLIICRDNSLFRVPYFTKFLESFHMEALFDRGHEAYIFAGRSELDELEKVVPFSNLPYRNLYDTNQLFEENTEYINGDYVDMRASYTYVPTYLRTKQKFIDYHQNQIAQLSNKDNTVMAVQKSGLSTGSIIKIALMLIFLVGFLYFNNPMDNPLIADEKPLPQQPSTSQAQPAQEPPLTTLSQPTVADTKKIDFIQSLFTDYRPRLSAYASSQDFGVTLIIDFYKGSEIQERLVLDDFHVNGYSVTPSGSNAVIVESTDFKHRVTPWPLSVPVYVPAPDIVLTAN